VGRALAERGYGVHAVDLRGHGRSEGPRALVRSFDEYLLDADAVVADAGAAGAPVFLLGHSMGGAIVALAAVEGRAGVAGLLLSGAALPVDGRAGVRARLFRIIGRLFPSLPLAKLRAGDVSRDLEEVRKYDSDPLVYRGRMKAGLVAAMIDASQRIWRGAPAIAHPLLIMHGTADALTSPAGSRALYERCQSTDKTLRPYDGLYHEILNEPERARVIDDIAAWLDART
jgi:alpha-beta hydrolase superfamily lysophospholipase